MDKYGTEGDPACYPGSSTLINLLGIQDEKRLEEAEREISLFNAKEIEFKAPPYTLDYLCNIHNQLFSDIYAWAGEIRDIDISKGGTRFCNVSRILPEAKKLFSSLAKLNYLEDLSKADLVTHTAEFYGDINMLHPFRDGNGRAQRILFEHIIINAGYEISWGDVTIDEWIPANIASVNCNYSLLETLFRKCIGQPITD